MLACGSARLEDCALNVFATVVSRAGPDRGILDAGSKTLTSDVGGLDGHGLILEHPQARIKGFAEEHGFVGVVVVLGLYLLLLMQIVQNAQTASDKAGIYICMGIGMTLLFHLLANVGMVIGRMPVVGIPLPLMSYGGSSILTTFMMLGLVNNVRLRRFVN